MSPSKLQKLIDEGIRHHLAGRLLEADGLYTQVRRELPKSFDANHLAGLLAYQQGRNQDAFDLLGKAHRLNPREDQCEVRLALVLMSLGRKGDAEKHLKAVVTRSPGFLEAWENYALCLKMLDRFGEAVVCHQKALALKPQNALGWYNFGLTLSLMGRMGEALGCHERALAIDPKLSYGHYGRAQALYQSHRVVEAVEAYDRFLAAEPDHMEARSYRLFALNYLDSISKEELFREHVAFGEAAGEHPVPVFPNPKDPERKLRVGILSCDLRTHSCAFFLEPLVREADKGRIEFLFYFDHFREDAVSQRLKAHGALWRPMIGLSPEAVEAQIRADAPDILIDLVGHTGMTNRMALYARHLAPVQVNYLGYPNTTGLKAMHYRFTDAIADPAPAADALATEELVRFAPTAWCYEPAPNVPDVSPLPSAAGRPFTFGCFNNLGKITDQALSLWARVLAAVPGSRLALKGRGLTDPNTRRRYLQRLQGQGLPLERVDLIERTTSPAEHLALYSRIDVTLDSYPYHGTTTTCEALWQGLPVVTLMGDRHVSRVSGSLVASVGHPEWAAASVDDYVRVAVSLASDISALSRIRAGLRREMAASALMDHRGQARRFEEALRGCWKRYCAS